MDVNENVPFKCRKCRTVLFSDSFACTNHGEPFRTGVDCDGKKFDGVWYLKEDRISDWMKVQFDKENWTKGKVSCPKCDSRIGSFNFVSGQKCHCGIAVVPPIHVVKTKVDLDQKFELL